MINNIIKYHANFIICQKTYLIFKESKFSTFNNYCNYIKLYLVKGDNNFKISKTNLTRSFWKELQTELTQFFGFDYKTIAELIFDFFYYNLWTKYEEIVLLYRRTFLSNWL